MSFCEHLPEELWKLVLRHVPSSQRLCVCASVSKQLYRAAVAATDHVTYDPGNPGKKTEYFWQWMDHHGHHVTSLWLRSKPDAIARPQLSRLPSPNLRQLRLHRCSVQLGPSSDQPGVLQACTALTSLVLWKCDLVGGRDSLAALSAVPTLQELVLYRLGHEEDPDFTAFDLPAAALGPLHQLTHLQVEQTAVCLQHIGCLKGLQVLVLKNTPGVSVSAFSTPGLDQLTALRNVDVHEVPLDPAALHGGTTLQHLSLYSIDITSERMQSLLALLAQQHQLQQLQLVDMTCTGHPSAYTALSASSRLQTLSLPNCTFPAGVWQQVFRPGLQLPELCSLMVAHHGIYEAALFSQQDVGALASCCPALRSVGIHTQPGAQLTALAQLTGLTDLSLIGPDSTSCSSLSALSALRSLSDLFVYGRDLTEASLLPLTALQHLTRLRVDSHHTRGGFHEFYWKGPTSGRAVWKQLLEHCQQLTARRWTAHVPGCTCF